jgi:hypothetical protein
MKLPLTFVAVAGLCFVVSCASPFAEADRGVEGTLRSTITDRDVDVSVDRGVVTLEGKVNTEADRQRIDMLARRTAGVVAVKNELEVTLPSPGDYGAIPGSSRLRTAPPTAVVTEPPATVVTESPGVVVTPIPSDTAPPVVVVPNTPRVKVQPATPTDQATANRVAQQLSSDPVATTEFDNVTITVNSGTASIKGVVDSQSKREALTTSVQRAGGITTIYDQLMVR